MILVSETISISMVILASDDDNYSHPKFYDWLLVLPKEVTYIWRASWNYTKVLYLLTRYTPFASTALMLRSEFHVGLHPPIHLRFPASSSVKTHITCAPGCHTSIPCPVQSRRPLSFDHIPIVAVQLTFTDFPFFSFLIGQFASHATPESCRETLRAVCCRCLLFHFVTTALLFLPP